MAHPSTLYRFKCSVSDIDRALYERVDIRVAMHPSETDEFLLTRVIAYALNYQVGLEFTAGLSSPDEPAVRLLGPAGNHVLWIDIGNPTAKRLHKASKLSEHVRIYTYKDPENIKREMAGQSIHRAEDIAIFSIDSKFLQALIPHLKRDNSWTVMHNEGELVVGFEENDESVTTDIHRLNGIR